MGKVKLIYIVFVTLCLVTISFSQLPNFNMHVLANLNQHITTDTYSGCWGYIAPNGREYAILGTHLGTAFIDITDSAYIHEIAFVPTPAPNQSGNHWREITVYSHYAYIVSEAGESGIEIVDLQYLPDSIHYVTDHFLTNHTTSHTISVSGSFLYLNGANSVFNGGGVTILDMANPVAPLRRGTWNNLYVHDCRVVNDTIYAANINTGRITIINAVNKDNLQEITFFQTAPHYTTHNCALTRDRRYIFTTDETASPTPGTLKVYNIQNLSNITFVTDWHPTGITTSQVHNVEIFGDTAVVAHRTAGVRVLNISNPHNPVEIAWYDTYPQNDGSAQVGTWGAYMFPSRKVICSNKETGLWVLKFGSLVGINNNGSQPLKFELQQNYPNPFNPITKIRYSVSSSNHIKVGVFSIKGQLVQILVNQKQSKGIYEVDFNGSNLASGVYFYRLTAGNKQSDVKKMVLLK